jgi:hypothetical protein
MSQNGKLLTQIMNNLDKPKKFSRPKNQWQDPGEITTIPSNRITMEGVSYPVYGKPDKGPGTMMMPGQDYYFPGASSVTEYPFMAEGGYVVSQSSERKGKTHKVTGPDGSVKYFGDSKLGQHPDDPERKAAFYARHEKNLDANPHFRAFARATWANGGTINNNIMMQNGGGLLSKSVTCSNCGHSWKSTDGGLDPLTCHNCGGLVSMAKGGQMIKRADGSYSRRGLWDNIRANKGSGKKPTKEMLEQERKINAQDKYQKGGPKKGGAKAPVETNPYKDIMSLGADFFRNILPVPDNVAQLAAKQILGDARMSNDSLEDRQKIMLWDVIQNAKKRTGKNNSGTEYQDYGNLGYGTPDNYDDWFNRGKVGVTDLIGKSLTNDGFKLASTIGRGRYWTDEKDPDTIYYTDVYDWNSGEKNFKGTNQYQNIRNYVRSTEDKNLNADKNEMYRMNFKFSKKEIEDLRAKQQNKDQGLLGLGMFSRGGMYPKMQTGGTDDGPPVGDGSSMGMPKTLGMPGRRPLPLGFNFAANQDNLYNLKYRINAGGDQNDGKFKITDPRQLLELQLLEGVLGGKRSMNITGEKSKRNLNIGLTGATPLFGGNFSLSGSYNKDYNNQPAEQMPEEQANFMRTPARSSSNFGVNASWSGKPFGKNGPNTKIGFTVGDSNGRGAGPGGPEIYRQGGEPQNAGWQALPERVQAEILSKMGYGGYYNPIMAEGGEPNGEMALGQMAAVQDKMNKLLKFVKPDDNLDPWIASKLAVMDHSADAIADYMMYGPEGQNEMEEGLPQAQDGWVQRAADARLNFWEKCGLASSADNGGGGRSGGGGSDAGPQYKDAFASLSDLSNDPFFDKKTIADVRKSRPSDVDKDMWNAVNAEARRVNNAFTNKYFWGDNANPATGRLDDKFLAEEYKQKINVPDYYRYYNSTMKDKKSVGAQDIYDYYKSQPNGMEAFRTLVNSGYVPKQRMGGYIGHDGKRHVSNTPSWSGNTGYQKGGEKTDDSTLENVAEIFDPTGISSWDDVYRSYKQTGMSPETALEVFGALPFLGKVGKVGKLLGQAGKAVAVTARQRNNVKAVSKALQAAPYIGRGTDATQAMQQARTSPLMPNFGMDNMPFEMGGYIPEYMSGGDYCYECGGPVYKMGGGYQATPKNKSKFTQSSKPMIPGGGPVVGDELEVSPEQLEQLRAQGYQFEII